MEYLLRAAGRLLDEREWSEMPAAYTAAGAELEVVAMPMARQGRMW